MLGQQSIVPPDLATSLDATFTKVDHEIADGTLGIDTRAKGIHSCIKDILTTRLGDAGHMVHTGRSRNDQLALDFQLYFKRNVLLLIVELNATIAAFLMPAENHAD
jgi:argininosuccinate lyase